MNKIGEMDRTAPPKVWLQIDPSGSAEERTQPIPREAWDELTWHHEPIGGQEVAYVREDIAQPLRIDRSSKLDEMIVYFDDFAPGKGRITIVCFGDAWTAVWGAMGNRTLRQFVAGVDPGYLSGALLECRKASNSYRKYTERVSAAVIEAIKAAG